PAFGRRDPAPGLDRVRYVLSSLRQIQIQTQARPSSGRSGSRRRKQGNRSMKKNPLPAALAACLLLSAPEVFAHGLWAESGEGGYKIFFGEAGNNLREKKDKLGRFAAIRTWKADGTEGKVEIRDDHLFAAVGTAGLVAANLDSPVREPKAG